MTQNDPTSYAVATLVIALTCCMMAGHVYILRSLRKAGRWRYLVVFSIIFIGTLFVPVMDGGEKMGWIPLWTAYHLLCIPEFYLVSNRDRIIDCLVFGFVIAHHFVCFTLALTITKRA
jgi:hypothetical protein